MKTFILVVAVLVATLVPPSVAANSHHTARLRSSTNKELFLQRAASGARTELNEEPNKEVEDGYVITATKQVWWKPESEFPFWICCLFAFSWVSMLSAIPIAIPMLDHRPITKTQTVLAGTTFMVMFGGFYLFTNIILFQSSHFKTIRPLTMVECIYFMAQTVTTIGYGDIGPAKTRGQIFVGIYVIFCLFVLAMVVEDFCEHVKKVAKDGARDAKANVAARLRAQQASTEGEEPQQGEDDKEETVKSIDSLISPPEPNAQSFIISLCVFLVIDVIFVFFYTHYPGENKTTAEAIYMSMITLGSVGFGFFTPLTEAGMIFAAFSMVIGCSTLMVVIGEFVAWLIAVNEYERFNKTEGKFLAIQRLKELIKGSDTVTAEQFLLFSLVMSRKVDQQEIEDITTAFQGLKPKNGEVKLLAIQQSCTPREMIVQ